MKKVLPYRSLSEREVPEHLDARVLSYAAAARGRTKRRRWVWITSAAAAVCIAAFTGIMFQMQQQRSAERSELLAMGDFSKLDQSAYNISFELALTADLGQF